MLAEKPGRRDRRDRRPAAHGSAEGRQRSRRLQPGTSLSGDVKPGANVLFFDDAGDHAALQAAEFIAASGAKLEIMTPDRSFAPEVMAMNLVPYMRGAAEARCDLHGDVSPRSGAARRQHLLATLGSDYGGVRKERQSTRSWSTTARCRTMSSTSP